MVNIIQKEMNTEIIIGREPISRRLRVKRGEKAELHGAEGSVPQSVSREHASLNPINNNRWQLCNLNEQNVTYVNGLSVESRVVSEQDRVELGPDRYLLNWVAITGPKEELIDPTPLRKAWTEYTKENARIRQRQKTTGLLSSVPMAFTMMGGLVSGAMPAVRTVALIFTAIALIILLYGFYRRFTDKSEEETKAAMDILTRNYVCPKCGKFMGYHQDYKVLMQNGSCPYCKKKFKKSNRTVL